MRAFAAHLSRSNSTAALSRSMLMPMLMRNCKTSSSVRKALPLASLWNSSVISWLSVEPETPMLRRQDSDRLLFMLWCSWFRGESGAQSNAGKSVHALTKRELALRASRPGRRVTSSCISITRQSTNHHQWLECCKLVQTRSNRKVWVASCVSCIATLPCLPVRCSMRLLMTAAGEETRIHLGHAHVSAMCSSPRNFGI